MKAFILVVLLFLSFLSARGQSVAYKQEEHAVNVVNVSKRSITELYTEFSNVDWGDNMLKDYALNPQEGVRIKTLFVTTYKFGFKTADNKMCIVDNVYMNKNYVIFLGDVGCQIATEQDVLDFIKKRNIPNFIH